MLSVEGGKFEGEGPEARSSGYLQKMGRKTQYLSRDFMGENSGKEAVS